jgi:retron-type reverse transcriptase
MEVERYNSVSNTWEVSNKNVLPQGAPTSPILTNIVCYKLDRRLTGLAKRFGLNYTRYADDITFSSSHNVYGKNGEFLNELNRIIVDQGFTIKESKTRLQKEGFRQEVTGLLVGDKVNVQKRYIKQIRMWLYYWETYGIAKSQLIFNESYLKDRGNIKKRTPSLSLVLKGKLDFLKMVVGEQSSVYESLLNRYNKLTSKKIPTVNRESHLNFILNELLEKGVSSAMSQFKL